MADYASSSTVRGRGYKLNWIVRDCQKGSPALLRMNASLRNDRRLLYIATDPERIFTSAAAIERSLRPYAFTYGASMRGLNGFEVRRCWPKQLWNRERPLLDGKAVNNKARLALHLEGMAPNFADLIFMARHTEHGMACSLRFLKRVQAEYKCTRFWELPFADNKNLGLEQGSQRRQSNIFGRRVSRREGNAYRYNASFLKSGRHTRCAKYLDWGPARGTSTARACALGGQEFQGAHGGLSTRRTLVPSIGIHSKLINNQHCYHASQVGPK